MVRNRQGPWRSSASAWIFHAPSLDNKRVSIAGLIATAVWVALLSLTRPGERLKVIGMRGGIAVNQLLLALVAVSVAALTGCVVAPARYYPARAVVIAPAPLVVVHPYRR